MGEAEAEKKPINGWMANVGTIVGFFGNYRLSEFFCNPAISQDLVARRYPKHHSYDYCQRDFLTRLEPSPPSSQGLPLATTNRENAERRNEEKKKQAEAFVM